MTSRARKHSLPATALAACVLGLVLCPVPFIVLAARGELSPRALITTASPFAIGATILLQRFLRSPSAETISRNTMPLLELASWVAVGSFLFFISQIHLLRGIERWGAVSMMFLGTSVCAAPLVCLRPTALEQRLGRMPPRVIAAALCILLTLAALLLFSYLTTPARFI